MQCVHPRDQRLHHRDQCCQDQRDSEEHALGRMVSRNTFLSFLNLLLTEKRSFPSGRDIGDDHCEDNHHRHHRCDPHCYLCISFKNNSELSMIRAQNAFPE